MLFGFDVGLWFIVWALLWVGFGLDFLVVYDFADTFWFVNDLRRYVGCG